MKKLMISAALMAACATTTMAQNWIGGSFNVNQQNDSYDNGDSNHGDATANNLGFNIDAGHALNDKWAIAIGLGYHHTEYTSATKGTNSFDISPYVRRQLASWNRLSLFADAGVAYTLRHQNGFEVNNHSLLLYIGPGLDYELNERIGLEAHFGNLSWEHDWHKEPDYKGNTFDLSLSSYLSLGFYINL